MRRLTFAALFLVAGLTSGCASGSYDQAFGRPDATRWTYFETTPTRVAQSVESWFSLNGWYLESSERETAGVVLTFSPREGGAGIQSVRVEPSTDERFGARAQVVPTRRPLPRDLETYVASGRD